MELGEGLAVAELVPGHRALAVGFGGNGEESGDLMIAIDAGSAVWSAPRWVVPARDGRRTRNGERGNSQRFDRLRRLENGLHRARGEVDQSKVVAGWDIDQVRRHVPSRSESDVPHSTPNRSRSVPSSIANSP